MIGEFNITDQIYNFYGLLIASILLLVIGVVASNNAIKKFQKNWKFGAILMFKENANN